MDNFDMRIAFPTNDRMTVEEHFGHAKEFAFANVKDGKVISTEYLTPPPHEPGVIPAFVGEKKATAIITGGMGGMAIDLFKQQGIDVILGAKGSINETLETYIQGELASTGSACTHDHNH
jgi:predicted Fe-Mo cluster-binding NifX family protein